MTNKFCEKCGRMFEMTKYRLDHPTTINATLCDRCLEAWHMFFKKNYRKLDRKSCAQNPNPTWRTFMLNNNKLKEIVNFD